MWGYMRYSCRAETQIIQTSDKIVVVRKRCVLCIPVDEIPEPLRVLENILRNVLVVVHSVVVLAPSAEEVDAVPNSIGDGFGVSVLGGVPLVGVRERGHFLVDFLDGRETG
jgi:hypothetical protein